MFKINGKNAFQQKKQESELKFNPGLAVIDLKQPRGLVCLVFEKS